MKGKVWRPRRGRRWVQWAIVAALAIGVVVQAVGALSATAAGDYSIYSDSLGSGWSNWSWSTTVNASATSPVRGGTKSVALTFNAAWAGLYFRTSGISTSGYNNLQFYLNGGTASGQLASVSLYDSAGKQIPGAQSVNKYIQGGSIAAGQWRMVSVPLASLGGANRTITGVLIQDASGRAQPAIYLDDMLLTASTTSTTTTTAATSTPAPTTAPVATATPATPSTSVASGVSIYGDSFASGWTNWSWSTTTNFTTASPVRVGAYSAGFTYNAGWGGLYFHNAGVNTTGYSNLQFYLNGGSSSGQLASVSLYDDLGNRIPSAQAVNKYIEGGSIASGAWRLVSIPLADLGGANRKISGILVQDMSGRAQPTIYLDDMRLAGTSTATTSAPTAASTPMPNATSGGAITGSTQPYTGIPNSPHEYLTAKGAVQWLYEIKFVVADAVRRGLLRADEVPLWQNVLLGQIGVESVGRNFSLGAAASQWYSQGLTQQVYANHYREEAPYDPVTNLRANLRTLVRYYRQHGNRWDWAVAQHVTGKADETAAKTMADWNGTTGLMYAQRAVNVVWWANRLLNGGDVFPAKYYSFQLTGNGSFDKAPLWDIFSSPNLAFNWNAPSNSTAGSYQSLGADSKISQPINTSTWMAVPGWFYTTSPGASVATYQPPAPTSTQAAQYPAGSTLNAPWSETYPRQQWAPPPGTTTQSYYGPLAP